MRGVQAGPPLSSVGVNRSDQFTGGSLLEPLTRETFQGHGSLIGPSGLAIYKNNLLIASTGSHEILIWDPSRNIALDPITPRDFNGDFANPRYLLVEKDILYIVSLEKKVIYRYDLANRRALRKLTNEDFRGHGTLSTPSGVAIYRNILYISNLTGYAILCYDTNAKKAVDPILYEAFRDSIRLYLPGGMSVHENTLLLPAEAIGQRPSAKIIRYHLGRQEALTPITPEDFHGYGLLTNPQSVKVLNQILYILDRTDVLRRNLVTRESLEPLDLLAFSQSYGHLRGDAILPMDITVHGNIGYISNFATNAVYRILLSDLVQVPIQDSPDLNDNPSDDFDNPEPTMERGEPDDPSGRTHRATETSL